MDNQPQEAVRQEGLVGRKKIEVLSDAEREALSAVREKVSGLTGAQEVVVEFTNFCRKREASKLAEEPDLAHKFTRFICDHTAVDSVPGEVIDQIRAAIAAEIGQKSVAENSPPAPGPAQGDEGEPGPALSNVEDAAAPASAEAAPTVQAQQSTQADAGVVNSLVDEALSEAARPSLANPEAHDVSEAMLDAQNVDLSEDALSPPAAPQVDAPVAGASATPAEDVVRQSDPAQSPSQSSQQEEQRRQEAAFKAGQVQAQQQQPQGRPMSVVEYLFRSLGDRLSGRNKTSGPVVGPSGTIVPESTLAQWQAGVASSNERLDKLKKASTALATLDSAAGPEKVAQAKREVDLAAEEVARGFQNNVNSMLEEVNKGNISQEHAFAALTEHQQQIDTAMKDIIGVQPGLTPSSRSTDASDAPAVDPAQGQEASAGKKDAKPDDAAKKEGVLGYLSDVNTKLQEALKAILQSFKSVVENLLKPKSSAGPRPR